MFILLIISKQGQMNRLSVEAKLSTTLNTETFSQNKKNERSPIAFRPLLSASLDFTSRWVSACSFSVSHPSFTRRRARGIVRPLGPASVSLRCAIIYTGTFDAPLKKRENQLYSKYVPVNALSRKARGLTYLAHSTRRSFEGQYKGGQTCVAISGTMQGLT